MSSPNFDYENIFWQKGIKFVAGVDEVGRGAFAGPVVAGCVVFNSNIEIPQNVLINDSKKLTSTQREVACKWIKENALSWGVGEVGVPHINKLGIGKSAFMAFRKAVLSANLKPNLTIEYILSDAFLIPYLPKLPKKSHQTAIIKGDSLSVSIAAASIIAKVYRDGLMSKLGENFKPYKWNQNKGYGTKLHREVLLKKGTTKHHRTVFINTWLHKLSTKI